MKRILSLLLCFCLIAGLFSGCGEDPEAYVPTGDALVLDGQDPEAMGPRKKK